MGKKKHTKQQKRQPVAIPTVGSIQQKPTKIAEVIGLRFRTNLEWVLLGFIGLLPFIAVPGVQLRMIGIYTFGVVFSLIFFAYILYGQAKGYLKIPRLTWLLWIVIGWLAIRFVAALHGASFMTSLLEYWEGSWSDGLLFSLCQLLLAYSVVSLRPGKEFFKWLLYVLALQAFYMAFVSISSAISLGFPHILPRSQSFFQNSDAYIAYTLLTMPLVLLLAWKTLHESAHIVYKVVAGIVGLTVLAGFYFSLPGAIQHIFLKLPIQNATTTEVSGSNGIAPVQDFLQDTSNTQRFTLWKIGGIIAKDNPVFGVGPGLARFQFYQLVKDANPPFSWNYPDDIAMSYPHNELISQADSSGFGGLALYVAFWVGLVGILVQKRKYVESDNYAVFIVGAISLALYFVFNIFYFQNAISGLISSLLIGLLLSLALKEEYVEKFRIAWLNWTAVLGVIIAGCLAFGFAIKEVYAQSSLDLSASALANKNSTDSTQLAVDAAEQFPYEAYYQANAANTCYNLALNPPTGMSDADRTSLAVHAMSFADAAVKLEPGNPRYILMQGAAYYLFNKAGSSEEQKGLDDLRKAVDLGSHFYNIPIQAAHIAHFKGDAALTKEFAEAAINQATLADKKAAHKEADPLLKEVSPAS